MTARDRVDAAVARVTQPAPTPPEMFVFRVAMDGGRAAVITIPMDTTDTELIKLVGLIAGPGRVELAGQQAKTATKLVRATAMPRPV